MKRRRSDLEEAWISSWIVVLFVGGALVLIHFLVKIASLFSHY